MGVPKIRKTTLIPTKDIPADPNFLGLRIIHADCDSTAEKNFNSSHYEVQLDITMRPVWGVLALKGARATPDSDTGYRLVFIPANLSLREFTKLVKYDPANPPTEDYEALGMIDAHRQTQSDFKGAKKTNLLDFRNYITEAMGGERTAYLPAVAAWMSEKAFDQTVFVAVHQSSPGAYYGQIFLPDKPIMQADGQTQTAALFAADALEVALKEREHFYVSIEIELKVAQRSAAQSFVDRNGRGTKKNKNLVANFNTVDGLPTLRLAAVKGTEFEHRLHDGRNKKPGEVAGENIIDLSTLEQLCLLVLSGGNLKAEHIKGYHVEALTPFVHDFFSMLDRVFGKKAWPREVKAGEDPYRRIYIHGWPFALKAIAQAYFAARQQEIAPYLEAIKTGPEVGEETKESYMKRVARNKASGKSVPEAISVDELERRLRKIDWRRTRDHWIQITGYPLTKEGLPKTKKLADGSTVVVGNTPNTAAAISAVKNKLLANNWEDLTSKKDFGEQPNDRPS